MTALRSPISPQFASSQKASIADRADLVRRPVDFPGRWIGGVVGAVASLVVGAVFWALAQFDLEPLVSSDLVGFAAVIAFLGIPIAFVLGRHFAPIASDGTWQSGLSVAVGFALIAPPLGDLEIVVGSGLAPWMVGDSVNVATAVFGGLLVGAVGLVVSYIALPVTAAVAVVWIVLMRAVVGDLPARLRMPSPISRLGVRHAAVLLIAWLVIAWTVWTVVNR